MYTFTLFLILLQNVTFNKIEFEKLNFSEGKIEYTLDTISSKDHIDYGTHYYTINNSQVKLSAIKFSNDSIQLSYDSLILNCKTTLTSLKDIFPESYKSRNMGPSLYRSYSDSSEDLKYDFINLYSDSNKLKTIQLVFIDSKLVFAEFSYLGNEY